MSEVVFILGAGASKDAGAPLMCEFLDEADRLRKRESEARAATKEFEDVFSAISHLQRVHSKSELDLDNIESIYAAFEMAKLLKRFPERDGAAIDTLLVSLRTLICVTLDYTVCYNCREGHILARPAYGHFAELLTEVLEGASKRTASVISFNYDIALDHALLGAGLRPNYALNGLLDISQRAVNLLKLHGSLNWLRCPRCGTITAWELRDYFQKYSPAPGRDAPSVIRVPISRHLASAGFRCCDEKIQPDPFIVPPTWSKTGYHEGIASVWRAAAFALSDAEYIFVSGYSLSEADSFFRLLYALGSVGPKRIKCFAVFDPDPTGAVERRFRGMVGQGVRDRFEFHKKTFLDSVAAVRDRLATR